VTQTLPLLIEPETFAHVVHDVAGDPGILLIHVAEPAAYQRAHLPGAQPVTPRALVSGTPPAPGRLPDQARLEALFSGLGYRPEQHVVVYDDEGGGWAGRFIWTLDVIGHRRWSYLNGGIQAWHAAGLPLESGPGREPAPVPVSLVLDPAPIAELEDVLAAMGDQGQVIWDVRSAEEYRGEKSGSPRAGHIPTAVNLDWMDLQDPSRQLRLVAGLAELLTARGIDPAKRVITHCQTHHRSGLSYLVGRLLGFREIRAYHGSWAEWGNRYDTPVAIGPEPGQPEDHVR
jgi:thiosulfate/3-mercaptopyruvate sulfurtransferase